MSLSELPGSDDAAAPPTCPLSDDPAIPLFQRGHMTKSKKPQIIEGYIYKVYFESLYDENDRRKDPHRTRFCSVIAVDIESAIEKVHAAYPGERISSLHTDHFGGDPPRKEKLIL
jgi:hypothetical protein